MDIIARRIPTAVRASIATDDVHEVEVVVGTSHFMLTDNNQEGLKIQKLNGDMTISIIINEQIMIK